MSTPLPATVDWLLRGKDGRLTAYSPVDGGVLRWTESRPGGPGWDGPDLLPAPGLLPYLSIVQSTEGYVYLTGLRRLPGADGLLDVDVLYGVQYQTGRPMRDWHSLTSPYTVPRVKHFAAEMGVPVSFVDATGSLHVMLRNAGGGVSGRSQNPVRWQPKWADLKGSDVTGTVAVTVNEAGHVDVFAPSAEHVLRWSQDTGGAEFPRVDALTAAVADGTFTALRTGSDTVTRFWRDAHSGEVLAWRPGAGPRSLGGATGTGPLALLRTPVDGVDCTLLAQRDASGRVALAAYPTEHEDAGLSWTPTGPVVTGAPALALDGRGRIVLAAIAEDGGLLVTRQKDESGLALEEWTRA
ncbi:MULTISPECIES: hypothetical protein [Streptomyces]|uniref:LigA protein n=1 Tax=Streptomyces solicathayae TaxID=3081768 RepID=A0ABZ0LQC1_9ACTN|nr:hypothetical protein [Streptomyces sp. HUAS YS2]WOX21515.1 hypothetical protein R2D22_08945 [Streptomyces sp. HUAS YS2]